MHTHCLHPCSFTFASYLGNKLPVILRKHYKHYHSYTNYNSNNSYHKQQWFVFIWHCTFFNLKIFTICKNESNLHSEEFLNQAEEVILNNQMWERSCQLTVGVFCWERKVLCDFRRVCRFPSVYRTNFTYTAKGQESLRSGEWMEHSPSLSCVFTCHWWSGTKPYIKPSSNTVQKPVSSAPECPPELF